MTDDRVRQARLVVGNYVEPHLGMPLAEAKAVKSVRSEAGSVVVEVELGFPAGRYGPELAATLERLLAAEPQVGPARVVVTWRVAAQAVQGGLKPLPGISNVIAVASGKGGVGKSTTAVNMALALALDGARVGLLDADIYGPSQPRMMGLQGERPMSRDGRRIEPLEAHGVKVISIGFLIEEEQPMVWRGPMVTQALTQLLGDTNWGELDYLVVDMPPGTGDIQLTLSQRVPVSGAVVVTTPQDIALLDARKGLRMFQKVAIPVLGVVENMSIHICSKCGHEEPIFGTGGGARMAEQYGVRLLGQLPLDIRIREETDAGRPTVVADPDGPVGRAYLETARRAAAQLSIAAGSGVAAPSITVEET
ncbi:MAG: ATP-binding protein involved in chromosome partitioning [Pseudomonadota bacterium]|nr:ATP-binding protein involved in chromosome partitioning [Pseudomonadota bacterium]MDQ1343069.1 ATP-binding protein involved in chromosome partitioning [Pseudomonadota bacterium]